jgi:hypothetical protein
MSTTLTLVLSLLACEQPAEETPVPAPSLAVHQDALGITDLAWDAIAMSPDWLTDDLVIAFDRLDSTLQDDLAMLIVDNDEPWTWDEVAFTIAHTSPEVLGAGWFYPQLLVENVQLMYLHDQSLDYVEIVDVGEPGVDPDYHSVTTYQVDSGGEIVTRTVDRDTYYWYVVHPRLEDESPMYVDGWEECGSAQCPTTPELGRFWRDFLWSGARDDCPAETDCVVLDEILPGVEVLWREELYSRDDNGAVGELIQFVLDTMNFGAQSDQQRSVQPNSVYALVYGNCGEHSDITGAAARTALIPSQNVSAWGNDHTWNEFWDEGWMQWEPVNTYVGHWYYYADSNGDYYRSSDKLDNDCDGIADNGGGEPTDEMLFGDYDEDGYSIDDGDCNDADPEVYPGAPERENLRDDDCDGWADDGTETEDEDGDGVSIAEGDCDDTRDNVYPGAPDTVTPSSNRIQAISVTRGDTLITQRTDFYGNAVTLNVTMTDEEGTPLDGARITIFGRAEVYGYDTYWWPNTMAVTDLNGQAQLILGEANDYAWRVDHPLGSYPANSDDSRQSHSWPYDTDSLVLDEWLDAFIPDGLSIAEADSGDGARRDASVTIDVTLESNRVWANAWFGTTTVAHDGGKLTRFVVDQTNYDAFVAGDSFEALALDRLSASATAEVALNSDQDWYVVLANERSTSTTMIGTLAVTVAGEWDAAAIEQRFYVGPGEHVAVAMTPPQ